MSDRVEDILDRLDGVETRPRRLDRDARRALAAVLVVASASAALALVPRLSPASSDVPATMPASTDVLGAIERLRIEPPTDVEEGSDSGPLPATPEDTDGYESIEAIAPGRRT